MATPIRSYRPQVRIILKHGTHLEQQLGDVGTVTVTKNLYAPAGEFQIAFPDMPYHQGGGWPGGPNITQRKSLYDIIDVLDPIEIWLKRWQDGSSTDNDWVPVLRGFVRSIGRQEQVGADGRVQRQVVVAGHDCGAVFVMEQIVPNITAMETGVPIPPVLEHLIRFDLSPEAMKLPNFMWDLATQTTQHIMDTAGWGFSKAFSVQKGYALPWVAFATEGPVWEMLKRYTDAPWNEFYVREGSDQPELVFRPTPWRDIDDQWLPDVAETPPFWPIPMRNVISLNAHRDDSEQVIYVFVTNANAGVGTNPLPLERGFGIIPQNERAKFGDRIQIVQEFVGATAASPTSLPEQEHQQMTVDYYDWLVARTDWLKRAGRQIHQFEHGNITIKGDPHIRAGDYITLLRGPLDWDGYVINVTHQYQPYQQFTTTLEYIRSNQWKQRQAVGDGIWDKERQQEG
jgi:hypothetical protein